MKRDNEERRRRGKRKKEQREAAQKNAHHDQGPLRSLCWSKMEMEFEVLVLFWRLEVSPWSPMIQLADLQQTYPAASV
jgi:hypothetical protein